MGRILVAEDDDDAREIFREVLEANGHEVDVARDGAETMARLRRTQFDVLLLDLMMPRMNGWEVRAAMLRDEKLSRLPVVIVTADATTSGEDWSLCAAGFLPKPISYTSLIVAVKRALAKYSRHGEGGRAAAGAALEKRP